MTSPTQPPKESLRDRISTRLSTDKRGRYIDAEALHTRRVTWAFYGLIVAVIVVIVAGLAYGFWESNLKPLANVDGREVSRGEWQDRARLERFRQDRAESRVRSALADGSIESGLADRRFADVAQAAPANDAEVMEDLVDLLYQRQLAEEEGITLSDEELEAAIVEDGTFPEAREVEALIVITEEQEAGQPATDEGIADARERAQAALEELRAGADAETLAETYAPAQYDSGYVTEGSLGDAAWNDAIFALESPGVTDIVEAGTGEQLISVVTQIVPAEPDGGFAEAVKGEVGEQVHRRNVELEALAAKLEAQVTEEALAQDYEQVRLAQIYLEGDPFAEPGTDEGDAHASHILYQPETPLDAEGQPTSLADLPEDDPAWAEAQTLAEQAAAELRAVDDIDARMDAFASRAQAESDDPGSGSRGGDLGYFSRATMVPEFADAIWEAQDPQRGDIIGPVRSQFGWHVILFDEFRPPLADRLAAVQAALAEDGADFAAVATEYSDGPEAADGGEIGWQRRDELDDITLLALTAIDVGGISEPVEDLDGYRIYLKEEEATRPLDEDAAADLAATAFPDWYGERRDEADLDGRISIDDSVYE